MALIEDSAGRTDNNSGYIRIFGNLELGKLCSRVHSTVIKAGNELEKLIAQYADTSKSFDDFIEGSVENGVYLIPKKVIKRSKLKSINKFEPDLLIFEIQDTKRHCYIIELKDGDNFDTKKSSGEKENMINFRNHIASEIPFVTSIHFCCFNQNDKELIVSGFKNKITKDEAMTGKELCELLLIDYDKIIDDRKKYAKDNFDYFIFSLLKINEVRDMIITKLEDIH